MAKQIDYPRLLRKIEGLGAPAPDALLHAPFPDRRNLTPSARLGTGPYDWPDTLAGRHATLIGTPDKIETRGLLARAALLKPSFLSVIWANENGGGSLSAWLDTLGWNAAQDALGHCRLAVIPNPEPSDFLDAWVMDAAPKEIPGTAFLAQAGLFSYREVDPASALLACNLPELNGVVADFGCGWGYLSHMMLQRGGIQRLYGIDDDARAVACARLNCPGDIARFLWADTTALALPERCDAIVMNPPFHAEGREDKNLGARFIESAACNLKKGGVLYMVANRHLPYERTLASHFGQIDVLCEGQGFKVIAAAL